MVSVSVHLHPDDAARVGNVIVWDNGKRRPYLSLDLDTAGLFAEVEAVDALIASLQSRRDELAEATANYDAAHAPAPERTNVAA